MANERILQVGVVCWEKHSGLMVMLGAALGRAGCQVSFIQPDERLDPDLDVVFAFGPFGSLVPIANQLLACSPAQRPLFVLWMTEQLPNPNLPGWTHYLVGALRSYAERVAYNRQEQGISQLATHLNWVPPKGLRYRYFGDLYWLRKAGLLSLLVVGSGWIADFLQRRGFTPLTGYYNFYSEWGADLGLNRDIPVLWLGKMGTDRRKEAFQQVRADLKKRGIEVLVIDGVENPYVFGEERTVLLNRTKITLNILRQKWDNHSMRYYLAASNRVLVVTEPTYPHLSFNPGEHLVEASIEQMADTISYYLTHEEERMALVNQAHHLVATELSVDQSIHQILEKVWRIQKNVPK